MGHSDGQPAFICKFLQCIFPSPKTVAIRTTTIRLNKKMLFSWKLPLSAPQPPTTNTSDSKFGCLMRDPDDYKPFVVRCIVNPVRNGHAIRIAGIVAFQNIQRTPTIGTPWIFKVPDQFTLFGIY